MLRSMSIHATKKNEIVQAHGHTGPHGSEWAAAWLHYSFCVLWCVIYKPKTGNVLDNFQSCELRKLEIAIEYLPQFWTNFEQILTILAEGCYIIIWHDRQTTIPSIPAWVCEIRACFRLVQNYANCSGSVYFRYYVCYQKYVLKCLNRAVNAIGDKAPATTDCCYCHTYGNAS